MSSLSGAAPAPRLIKTARIGKRRAEMGIMQCSSCGAEIIFLKTAKEKAMPVDYLSTIKQGDVFDHTKHTSHFATCPDAQRFRKKKKED
jgi:hypothetical protein